MAQKEPLSLRGKKTSPRGPWRVGEFNREFLTRFNREIVRALILWEDILVGNTFRDIFAEAINGRREPVDNYVGDVSLGRTCWSAKAVHSRNPHRAKSVKLNSCLSTPFHVSGISLPFEGAQETGDAVLSIWNERVDEINESHPDSRFIVLIGNMGKFEFTIFEEELTKYSPEDFTWTINPDKDYEGRKKSGGRHVFTWLPQESEIIMIRRVPSSAHRLRNGKGTIKELRKKTDDAIDFKVTYL